MKSHETPHYDPIPSPESAVLDDAVLELTYEESRKPTQFAESRFEDPSRLQMIAGGAKRATAAVINKIGATPLPAASAENVERIRQSAERYKIPDDDQ